MGNLRVLRGPSRTPFESFPTPWNPFADSSFALLTDPYIALGGNLFSLPNLWRIPLEFSPTPSWPFVVLRGFLFLAFVGNAQLFQVSQAPTPHGGAHHSEEKQPFVNEDEPPMNTNRHQDSWTSFNDNWRQNASALLSRWCDPVMGGSPPGSAGVPPAQILSQLRPSPPPESTGSGALPLLRPGPCGSRRQGGRLQHRRETERQPKGQHAGGTPALPGVSSRW